MGRSGIDGDGDSRGSWGGGGSDDNRGSWGRSSDSGRSGIDHGGGGFDFGGFNFGAPPPPPRRTRHSHHSGSHMYGGRPYIGDEAHLLLVFQDADGHYYPWVITGAQAKQVVDGEAVTILFDYIDRYYYDSSLSSEEFFSDVFESTADRIMDKTTNPVFIIGICFCGVVALFIIAVVVSNVLKHKKEEADRMERILNTDLSDQVEASPGLKDLEDKYK